MKVSNLKINHLVNPLGFDLGKPRFSFITSETSGKSQKAAQIRVALDDKMQSIIFDSGERDDIDSLAYKLPIKLDATTRYYWNVTVWADNGDTGTSETSWFETGKLKESWRGKWIKADLDDKIHPVLSKEFSISKDIISARAYVCGLGLYEMNINKEKVGEEYFTPNYNAYNKWLQYQSYDITDSLKPGDNIVEVSLGNGWYKGRFGFEGLTEGIYGDKFALLFEMVIKYSDGSNTIISSDDTWKARKSNIIDSSIYDGEIYDATLEEENIYKTVNIDLDYNKLKARLSLPVIIKERLKPIELIITPLGETVLDMGQNMVGWLQFRTNAPLGREIKLQYGEVLQEGNFYRDNLRSAKAEFTYKADGKETLVRPHFTFYGFRYVKVVGWEGEFNLEDFTGCVIYSDMEQTGSIETSDPLINKLILNALWGQKGNFLDTPTDCPQRDERMGWTGDAQVFSGTASFNMDTYAFFNKYLFDLGKEQETRGGMVPYVVPAVNLSGGGSSAWGDAATIIPWNVYLHFGDKAILEQQFDSMRGWVDYIKRVDDASGGARLWTVGFHYGDWLALDGNDPNSPFGGTETSFISSAYYAYSAGLVAKAAKVLGKKELAKDYRKLSKEIKNAMTEEYFTEKGRLAINTQTAYIISLFMNLVPKKYRERTIRDLESKLNSDNNYLKTGFVGTTYACRTLSENGENELAYTLLLNKDYPSWLYPVTMGATTIWERWNSILPDGKISGTGMNSLNHYAYGSIVEWMYRNMAGINPTEEKPGFRKAKLAPMPDPRFKYVKAKLASAAGLYESEWSIDENKLLTFKFVIPFNATATVILPKVKLQDVKLNGNLLKDMELPSWEQADNSCVDLYSGTWEFKCTQELVSL